MHARGLRIVNASRALALVGLTYATTLAALFVYGDAPRHRAESAWFIAGSASLAVLWARSSFAKLQNESASDTVPKAWWILLLTLTASVSVYWSILRAGLFSDDFVLLGRAASGVVTMGTDFFRPLPLSVWAVVNALGLANGIVLHCINALLHGVNAALVFWIGIRVGIGTGWSLAASALFLVNPASVEAVTWVSALFDVLMVSGILIYLLGCLGNAKAIAAIGLAVALLSKETAVAAAPLGFLIALVGRRSLWIAITGFAATAIFMGTRLWLLPPPDSYAAAPSGYILKELISRAFGALGVPWTSADVAAYPWLVALPWVAVAVLASIALFSAIERDRARVVVVLMAWIVISVIPVYGYFFVSTTLEGARYVYLGSVGFALLLPTLASATPLKSLQRVTAATLVACILTGTIGTVLHQQAWLAAAAERDAILVAAKATFADELRCPTISVAGLPDSLNGAYIFRNGFREALEMQGMDVPPIVLSAPACAYEWTGERFKRLD